MKNALAGVCIFILAAALVQGQPFSLKLTGGMTWINGDDYNIGVDSYSRYIRENFKILSGGFDPLKSAMNFQAELIFNFGRHLGVGLGAGYFGVSKDNTLTGQFGPDTTKYNYKPMLSAVPVFVNVHYQAAIMAKLNLDMFVGAAFYSVKFNFEQDAESSLLSARSSSQFESNPTALGIQGGLGLSFELLPRISLIADASFRLAKITELKGNWTYHYESSYGYTYDFSGPAYLWYYFENYGSGYPTIQVSSQDPTEPVYTDVRKAVLNLSGLSAVAGIKIRF
jgi:hypothetical protein